MKDTLCQYDTQHSLKHQQAGGKGEVPSSPRQFLENEQVGCQCDNKSNLKGLQCDIYSHEINFPPGSPQIESVNNSVSEDCWGGSSEEESPMLLQIEPSELLGSDAVQMNDSNSFRRETLKGYKLGKVVGRGAFSQVLVGVHKLSGRRVAIKVIEKSMLMSVSDHKRVEWEVAALQLLHHSNVLRLLEVVDLTHQLYMVTEYIPDGSLLDLLKNQGPLKEHKAAKYIAQVVLALIHCHKQGVVHRDIKLENLLLDKQTDQIKIVDFGLSGSWAPGRILNSCCGTASYAAPEIHGRKNYGPGVDVWSLGVVMYAMLTGKLPFTDPNKGRKIIQGDFEDPKNVSQCCKNLLRGMLTTDPSKRISLEGILKHPWIVPLMLNNGVLNEEEVFQYDLTRDPEHGFACPLTMIIQLQEKYGFNGSEVQRDLTESKCSGGSAAYFLLLQNLWEKQRRIGQDAGFFRQGQKLSFAPIGHMGRDDSARFVHVNSKHQHNNNNTFFVLRK
eukprot:TRINITY_DN5115_c0_g2_i1.p2 TRINITY_DN5115_c0_g2~~TRINITY_DN5115_c0_g2_i1.p2  ORF type:complete len:500 (-),score=70.94 TRINITY_DN5115_c0_g2_i1:770-2269(-)